MGMRWEDGILDTEEGHRKRYATSFMIFFFLAPTVYGFYTWGIPGLIGGVVAGLIMAYLWKLIIGLICLGLAVVFIIVLNNKWHPKEEKTEEPTEAVRPGPNAPPAEIPIEE